MRRLSVAALGLVLLVLGACTHGLELENGQRPAQPITRISFLFSEDQTDIVLNAPGSPAQPAERVAPTPPESPSATSTAEPTAAASPSVTARTAPTPVVDVAAIIANNTAMSLAIPATEVDPGLRTFADESDPSDHVTPALIAASGLASFFITGSHRETTVNTARTRPFQVVQRLFVHKDDAGAATMYRALLDQSHLDESEPGLAGSAVSYFRQFYPDLVASVRPNDQFQLGDENHLREIQIDPQVEPAERALGPADPHIYFLLLRQGRVAALFELFYLSPQDPATVTVLGERLINRIPSELSESGGSP